MKTGRCTRPNGMMTEARKRMFGHFSQTVQGQTTQLFAKGDKVYPTKIEVNVDKDTVAMAIVACDTCNKTDPPTYNKANVVFQFPKGSLAKASAGDVEDTIGQLLAISEDSAAAGSGRTATRRTAGQGGQQGRPTSRRSHSSSNSRPSRRPSRWDRPPIRCRRRWASPRRS